MAKQKKKVLTDEEFRDEVWTIFWCNKVTEITNFFGWVVLFAIVTFVLIPLIGLAIENTIIFDWISSLGLPTSNLGYFDYWSYGFFVCIHAVIIGFVIFMIFKLFFIWLESNYYEAWNEVDKEYRRRRK